MSSMPATTNGTETGSNLLPVSCRRSGRCRGRRNLSKEAAADVIGQVYNGRKTVQGGDRQNPQSEDFGRTCQAVAAELGVGRATVQRDAARQAPPACRRRVLVVDVERPVAGRQPARRSAVPMRSKSAGSRRRRSPAGVACQPTPRRTHDVDRRSHASRQTRRRTPAGSKPACGRLRVLPADCRSKRVLRSRRPRVRGEQT